MSHLLIYPMAFYVFYMSGLLTFSFRTRVKAIKERQVSIKFFNTYCGDNVPDDMIKRGRHFDNQFQLPMIFFISCLVHMVVDQVSLLTVVLAWGFVLSRLFHTAAHLGTNNVTLRASAYSLGWLLIFALWIHLLILI